MNRWITTRDNSPSRVLFRCAGAASFRGPAPGRRNRIDDFVASLGGSTMVTFTGWEGWQVLDQAGRRKYLSADERMRFLRAADRLAPAPRALCNVLAYAGCRVSEALALTTDHVDAERLTLTI